MIKQGKNTINCDECKAEISQIVMSTKYLKGIEINFFRCNACGTKYLVSVTDKATREKQYELINWSMQRSKALDIVIDGMSEEEKKKLAMLADECQFNIDRLTNEIKEAMAVLREKYEGEL